MKRLVSLVVETIQVNGAFVIFKLSIHTFLAYRNDSGAVEMQNYSMLNYPTQIHAFNLGILLETNQSVHKRIP